VPHWEARARIVRLSLAVIVALILATLAAFAFLPPPAHDVHSPSPSAHDVHSPGASAIEAYAADQHTAIPPNTVAIYGSITPSQSLADIRCQASQLDYGNPSRGDPTTCADAGRLALRYWPQLTQSANTLYIPLRCWGASPPKQAWEGFNVEYRPSSLTLVIHCYVAGSWLSLQPPVVGSLPIGQPLSLVVVSTAAISTGTIQIVQDDRIERLISDQSTEFQLATVTIS